MCNVCVENEIRIKESNPISNQFPSICRWSPYSRNRVRIKLFVYDFYKDVIKRLVPERTLTQILDEAENVEEFRLNPTKIQEEYGEFRRTNIGTEACA